MQLTEPQMSTVVPDPHKEACDWGPAQRQPHPLWIRKWIGNEQATLPRLRNMFFSSFSPFLCLSLLSLECMIPFIYPIIFSIVPISLFRYLGLTLFLDYFYLTHFITFFSSWWAMDLFGLLACAGFKVAAVCVRVCVHARVCRRVCASCPCAVSDTSIVLHPSPRWVY